MSDIREIVFDTETTGFDPGEHRVVEIGALELINHVPTGRTFHKYINPRRAMPADAFAVHGISDADLVGKPFFEDVAADWLEFIGDGVLVAHNAEFDLRFMNFEQTKAGHRDLSANRVIDTLQIARKKFPGAQNSLDALCRRFGLDLGRRVKHGALLDSELLAEVYLELLGGRQSGLFGDAKGGKSANAGALSAEFVPARARPDPRPTLLTDAEQAAHDGFVATLGGGGRWGAADPAA